MVGEVGKKKQRKEQELIHLCGAKGAIYKQ